MAGDWKLQPVGYVSGDVPLIVDLVLEGRLELVQVDPRLRREVYTQVCMRAHRARLACARRVAGFIPPPKRPPLDRDANAWAKMLAP